MNGMEAEKAVENKIEKGKMGGDRPDRVGAPAKKRSRGGQPGNSNALRHGFYSRKFQELEIEDLKVVAAGLADEIALLRVIARRLFEFSDMAGMTTVDEWIKLAGTLATISTKIAALQRTEKMLSGGQTSTVVNALSEAVASMRKEFNLK